MKLLLTSAGLTDGAVIVALRNLIGKDFKECTVVFVPTASSNDEGDKQFVVRDMATFNELGFSKIDIVDFSALEKGQWERRLALADVVFFEGGNPIYLMRALRKSGFADDVAKAMEGKVWLGSGGGSMVCAPDAVLSELQEVYYEDLEETVNEPCLGLVPFYVLPHLNNKTRFPNVRRENVEGRASLAGKKVYVLDDHCAVCVNGDEVKVVGVGEWFVMQ